MTLKAIGFISTLVRWIDDTYELLLAGGNVKEDVWWITTRVIRSIIEDYRSPARSTVAKTSFDPDSQRQSTLVWGVTMGHLSVDKMLTKYIKHHPIIAGDYAQWIVSNS